jgi:hypothetical protein
MHLATYVHLLEQGSTTLAESYRVVAEGHTDEPEIVAQAGRFERECRSQAERLGPVRGRYGDHPAPPPDRLHVPGIEHPRTGGLGMVRDLHELADIASHLKIAWTIVGQAAQGNRDPELGDLSESSEEEVSGQLAWLNTQIKTASAQALLVAD